MTTDHQNIEDLYRAYLAAMLAGDTASLRELTTDGYVLEHITGYRQPGEEWLTEMGEGQFIYYTATEQGAPRIEVSGDTAQLTSTIETDARIYGSRNRWRLNFTMTLSRAGGGAPWKIAENIARL